MVAKAKKKYKESHGKGTKLGKANVKLNHGGALPRTYTSVKRNDSFYYHCKFGHFVEDCNKQSFMSPNSE